MAEKPSLYLETSIPSYLAAYPSRDLLVAGHQQITRVWWDTSRSMFELFVSEITMSELKAGDPSAAARRLEIVGDISVLPLDGDIEELAGRYQSVLGLPPRAWVDSVHLAFAVVNEMSYLLTWNCAHIANGLVISRLTTHNSLARLHTPVIVTPEELLGPPEG